MTDNTMSPRYAAIILDLDGTMVDTIGDFVAALNASLNGCGLASAPPASIRKWIGAAASTLLREAAAHANQDSRDEVLLQRLRDGFYTHYGVINGQHAQVFDGVEHGLRSWRDAGVALACVTNKPEGHARDLLANKGLDGFFADRVWGGDSLVEKKPSALPLLTACAHMGVLPAQSLMVGDSQTDHGAAVAADMDVALLAWGYNNDQDIVELPAVFHGDNFHSLLAFTGVVARAA